MNSFPVRHRAYIWMNPVRKGMCADPEQYPHSGSFRMDWKQRISPVETWTRGRKAKAPA